MEKEVKHPEIHVQLVGQDGNAIRHYRQMLIGDAPSGIKQRRTGRIPKGSDQRQL